MTISSASSIPRFAYRPDIDGLRAIAVLAVVVFHLGFESLEGGFLGVDVFFVISGYLITSIIAPKMAAGTFSFKDFYLKRVRRLIPPALVTIAFTFLASAFILDPADLIAMAKSAIAATFSVSNILFFTEAGYWDAQSELKPLLHTWSLGVEEQFYLFWPLLTLLFWKLIPKLNLAWAFGLATVLGIFVSEWMLRTNPSAAFYLLPARFFEFSIGATFAFIGTSALWQKYGSTVFRLILGLGGLLVLLATIWIYKGDTPFPGGNAILPCLATAVLLLSGAGAGKTPVIGLLLGNGFITWVGRISYSLYLVHWPVVSLMRYKVGLELHLRDQIIAVILMVVLTLALYYGVEQRISARTGQGKATLPRLGKGRFAAYTGVTAVALSAVFAHAAMTSGWTWRFDDLSLTPEQIEAGKGKRFTLIPSQCAILSYPDGRNCDPEKSLAVLVFGNSHESDGYNFLSAGYGEDPNLQLISFGEVNRCDIVQRDDGNWVAERDTCTDRFAKLQTAKFARSIDIVAYAANKPFSGNKQVFIDIFSRMKQSNPNLKIVTFGGYVNTEVDCSKLINDTGTASACVAPENVVYHPGQDKDQDSYAALAGLSDVIIDYGELLCDGNPPASCAFKTPDNVPMIYDRHHLSFEFAQYAGRKFAGQNPDLLRELVREQSD